MPETLNFDYRWRASVDAPSDGTDPWGTELRTTITHIGDRSQYLYKRQFFAAVIDERNDPPGVPTDGDRYLIGSAPTGAWVGKTGQAAQWNTTLGDWLYDIPATGAVVSSQDTKDILRYDGTNWLSSNSFYESSSVDGLASALYVGGTSQINKRITIGYDTVGDQGNIGCVDVGVTWKPLVITSSSLIHETDSGGSTVVWTSDGNGLTLHSRTSDDGGKITLNPGTGYADAISFDRYQSSARIYWNSASSKDLYVSNLGAGTANVRVDGSLYTGGGAAQLSSDPNGALELGGISTAPYIDFHTWTSFIDYDVRLQASAGNGSTGNGRLTCSGQLVVDYPGTPTLVIKRQGGSDSNTSIGYEQAAGSWYVGANDSNYFVGRWNNADLTNPDWWMNPTGGFFASVHYIGDTNQYLSISGGNTIHQVDTNDYMAYLRSSNTWRWHVAGNSVVDINNIGLTCWGVTTDEGGQVTLAPGWGYSDNFYIDSYQSRGRLYWSSSVNKTIVMANYGTGSLTFSCEGLASFGTFLGNKILLFDGGSTLYGFGIQANTMEYFVGGTTNKHSFGHGSSGSLTEWARIDSNGLHFNNLALISSYFDSSNIDHIWHDDSANEWHFCSDTTYKAGGNSQIRIGTNGIRSSGSFIDIRGSDNVVAFKLVANNGTQKNTLQFINAGAAPTATPGAGGGYLYVNGGALYYKGSGGTVTLIANA